MEDVLPAKEDICRTLEEVFRAFGKVSGYWTMEDVSPAMEDVWRALEEVFRAFGKVSLIMEDVFLILPALAVLLSDLLEDDV